MKDEEGKIKKTTNYELITANWQRGRCGFTLIEILLVMGIFAILVGFSTINLLRPQTKASLEAAVGTLVADTKEQQVKAMVGDSEGLADAQPHGIYFEVDRYILFRGSYSPLEPSNFTINLDPNLTFSVLPPAQQIVFDKRSGEVASAPSSLTLQHAQSGEQKIITINKIGAISIN